MILADNLHRHIKNTSLQNNPLPSLSGISFSVVENATEDAQYVLQTGTHLSCSMTSQFKLYKQSASVKPRSQVQDKYPLPFITKHTYTQRVHNLVISRIKKPEFIRIKKRKVGKEREDTEFPELVKSKLNFEKEYVVTE